MAGSLKRDIVEPNIAGRGAIGDQAQRHTRIRTTVPGPSQILPTTGDARTQLPFSGDIVHIHARAAS